MFTQINRSYLPQFQKTMQRGLLSLQMTSSLAIVKKEDRVTAIPLNFSYKTNFPSPRKLEGHFKSHVNGKYLKFSNPNEYLADAQRIIRDGFQVQYRYKNPKNGMYEMRRGYIQFIGLSSKNQSPRFAFVGLNNNGEITTYHIRKHGSILKYFDFETIERLVCLGSETDLQLLEALSLKNSLRPRQ